MHKYGNAVTDVLLIEKRSVKVYCLEYLTLY